MTSSSDVLSTFSESLVNNSSSYSTSWFRSNQCRLPCSTQQQYRSTAPTLWCAAEESGFEDWSQGGPVDVFRELSYGRAAMHVKYQSFSKSELKMVRKRRQGVVTLRSLCQVLVKSPPPPPLPPCSSYDDDDPFSSTIACVCCVDVHPVPHSRLSQCYGSLTSSSMLLHVQKE